MSSDTHAMDQLHDLLRQRREAREPVEARNVFAQELPRRFVAAAREALGHALARFDLDVPAIEVEGERCHRVLRCETTSTSAVGPVRVERSVSRHPHGGHAVCPLARRAGIIEGSWTPLHDAITKPMRSVAQSTAWPLGSTTPPVGSDGAPPGRHPS